jgi:type I restriction enzyme R subunit
MENLDQSYRDFLEEAIHDYNKTFNTNYDTSPDKFQNYYKDISRRMKNREIDMLIVVNMFLTGFDATTLNTLWVDKNLRQHGLMQAFSRTNRILNSVKTYGNIVCFRDLRKETDQAIALFGNKDASSIVLLKTFNEYYNGYDDKGEHKPGYKELIQTLITKYPRGQRIIGEKAQKDFIQLYGAILRLINILTCFDEFAGKEILSEKEFQDYQSDYIDLYQEYRKSAEGNKETVNDDVVFEIELVKQIEVNIDYILKLVAKYQKTNCTDKTIRTTIDKAINSSIELRNKKDVINGFIDRVNASTKIDEEWHKFLQERKEADIKAIIEEEKLKPEEARRFINNAFRDGVLKTTGTAIDRFMPPISRFSDDRTVRKQKIIKKLTDLFEKYSGLI